MSALTPAEFRAWCERPNPFGLVRPTCRRCGELLGDCLGHYVDRAAVERTAGERLRARVWELLETVGDRELSDPVGGRKPT